MTLTVLQALNGAILIGPITVGDIDIDGNAVITGNVAATGTVTGSDLVATDDLTVGDDASIGGDLSVTGTATVGGSPVVTQTTGDVRYLRLIGGTLTGALLGTTATFSGAVGGVAGTFSGLLTTNGQVAFPATQNPSANPNVLDDYEVGGWTPALTFGGGSTGITYSFRSGTYIKIGDEVFFEMQVNLTSKGSSVGNALVTGLPFTPSTNSGASVGQFGTLAASFNLQASIGSTGVTPFAMGLAASSSQLNDTSFTNTSFFIISGHYRV
jgi:hypothetical protein